MTFNSRQFEEIYGYVEVSLTGTVTVGAVASATPVAVSVPCTISGTTVPATFALGDDLDVITPAAAATNGLQVIAAPTATPGTCSMVFINYTGASITPAAVAGYKIVARRVRPDISF